MSTPAPTKEKRPRLQRLSDWDDARYCNTAARSADDMRLTAVHFRLLAYLGRVNTNYGWCELSQKGVAKRWQYARPSINVAIGELVAWGYIEKRSQRITKTALCNYRVLIDPPAGEDDGADTGDCAADVSAIPDTPPGGDVSPIPDTPPGGDVSPIPDTPPWGDVSPIHDTRVGSDMTHVSPHKTQLLEQRTKNTLPLTPAGGKVRGRKFDEVEEVLGIVRSEKLDDAARVFAIDAVLAPLVRQRSLDAPSLEGSVRALADWIGSKKITAGEAAEVVAKLLGDRAKTVKPSDIEKAVAGRIGNRPPPALLAGDPVLMARWPDVLADLERRIGPVIVRAWFSTLVVDDLEAGVARLATHLRHTAQFVERDYAAQLRAALSAVFGEVQNVVISTRRAAA